jgi:hypothetical protein
MAEVAQNRVIGGSEIWQRWYYLMSLFSPLCLWTCRGTEGGEAYERF